MRVITILYYPRVYACKPDPNERNECDEYVIDYEQLIKHELVYSESTPNEDINRDIEFLHHSGVIAVTKWWENSTKEQ